MQSSARLRSVLLLCVSFFTSAHLLGLAANGSLHGAVTDPSGARVVKATVAVEDAVERWTFPKGSFAWPMGANGFIFRRADLNHLTENDKFEDCAVVVEMAQRGRREWLRITNRGVHHYVVSGLWDFIRKRRRQTFHFLSLRGQGARSWTQMNPSVPGWVACLYCVSVVGPLYHAARGLLQSGNPAWLWHPVASLASVLGVAWGLATHVLTGTNQEMEAKLQPRQKLAQQGGFTGLFAGVRPQRHIRDHGGRQRQKDDQAGDGEAHALGLRVGLRIRRLVVGRIRHAHRRAIDEVNVPIIP